jgi:hypothetical protein
MASDEIAVGAPLPRLESVEALGGRQVAVTWQGRPRQIVDLTPALASHRAFVRIRSDDALFRTVQVSQQGDCLEWPDGSELPAYWIEELAETPLGNAEFRDAMKSLQMSLDGMAARLGVARRLIADYRKDKPIPKHIALATRYLLEQRKVGS